MRISPEEVDFLKKEISSLVSEAVVYLFGSRIDDNKKGGDIDIMVLSNKRLSWKEKSRIKWHFCEKFGEQKIDIISFILEEENPFKQIVLREGRKL